MHFIYSEEALIMWLATQFIQQVGLLCHFHVGCHGTQLRDEGKWICVTSWPLTTEEVQTVQTHNSYSNSSLFSSFLLSPASTAYRYGCRPDYISWFSQRLHVFSWPTSSEFQREWSLSHPASDDWWLHWKLRGNLHIKPTEPWRWQHHLH